MKFNTGLASLILLCTTAIPAFAGQVHNDITFTGAGAATAASFNYDATTPRFSNFLVTFNSSS